MNRPIFNPLRIHNIRPAHRKRDWIKVRNEVDSLSEWGFNTLFGGLKEVVNSIVVEPCYVCKDHRNLYSYFYSKKSSLSSPYSTRLHFFSNEIDNLGDLLFSPASYADHYVGYSVIRAVQERCLGRTVLDPLKVLPEPPGKLYCLRTRFITHIAGHHFPVSGYPYMSQNGEATVCAHTALWGVCRYLSERYSIYKEVYPFDLVEMTETSLGRKFPLRGMTYTDYCSILSKFGCHPLFVRLKEHTTDRSYIPGRFETVYTWMESGFPVLASFPGHVVAVVGHTLDYEKPVQGTQVFVDSSHFVKHLVVVDDNFFPYQFLGQQADPLNYAGAYGFDIGSLSTAVCPLPEKVFLPADKAKAMAMDYLNSPELSQRVFDTGAGPFVTRFLLTTSSSFKRRKLETTTASRPDEINFVVTQLNMPHFVWVMEISPLTQYKAGQATCELVMDSTAGSHENPSIYLRIGNDLTFDGHRRKFTKSPALFCQYTHNLGET